VVPSEQLGGGADSRRGVGTTSRAGRNRIRRVQLDVGREVRVHRDRGTRGLALFQRELVGRRIQLAEVVDAGIGLRGRTGLHEVRDRDRRNRPMMATTIMISTSVKPASGCFCSFSCIFLFLFNGVGAQPAGYMSTALPTLLPVCYRVTAL